MLGFNPLNGAGNDFGLFFEPSASSFSQPIQPQQTMMGWVYTGTDDGGFTFSPVPTIWGPRLELNVTTSDGHLQLSGMYLTGSDATISAGFSLYTSNANVLVKSITSYCGLGERVFLASTFSGALTGARSSTITLSDYHLYFGDATRPAAEVSYTTINKGVIGQDAKDPRRFLGEDGSVEGRAWGPSVIVPRVLTLGEIRDFQFSPRVLPGAFVYYDPNAQGPTISDNTAGSGLPERSGNTHGQALTMLVDSDGTFPFITYPEPGYHRIASGGCG